MRIGRTWVAMGLAVAMASALAVAREAAALPPSEAILPGSQPPEIVSGLSLAQDPLVPLLHSDSGVQNCAQCHTPDIQRAWRGSMMAHASRDPLTWAALAVAERSVPGVGDTCLRCHVPKGWIGGRSLPSDGSALLATDADGVTCHLCHRLAAPDDTEPGVAGEQDPTFAARGFACATGDPQAGVGCDPGAGGAPCASAGACQEQAFLGNGMISLYQDDPDPQDIRRLGPYDFPGGGAWQEPPHNWKQSTFQRDGALCGTCHDVSNPVAGDLAPGHGRLDGPLPVGAFSGTPGDPVVRDKAAFRNPPYAYGAEQRTYSEWYASAWRDRLVSSFASLPAELRAAGGAPEAVADAAASTGGDYEDGTPRRFTCQSCHMRPVNAAGSTLSGARADLPRHDLTGANTWVPRAIAYLNGLGRLRIGNGLAPVAIADLEAGALRAQAMLQSAASLVFDGPPGLPDSVRVVNLSGHKLFTGYPDGRRMWLNVKWYGSGGALVREDGCYGLLPVQDDLDGNPLTQDSVETLLPAGGACAESPRVYEVESGISRAWAQRLVDDLAVPGSLPVRYDAETGAVAETIAEVAANPSGDYVARSAHLVLNDRILSDNRIPPYGMEYAEARKRNAVPVPEDLYLQGPPETGSIYAHYDDVALSPPPGAVRAQVALLYQTTSWEYVQFLWKANPGTGALATVGQDLLDAWRAEDMAPPVIVAAPEPTAAAAGLAAAATALALRRCIQRPASR
jgi:hypothetical protein